MSYKYIIKISHFNYTYLNKLIMNLNLIINLLLMPNHISMVNLPNKKITKTVLRSPHIFKKSREQFSKTIYTKLIIIKIDYNYTNIIKLFLKTLNCTSKLNISYEK